MRAEIGSCIKQSLDAGADWAQLLQMIHAWVYLSRQKDHGPGSRDGHGLVFQVTAGRALTSSGHACSDRDCACLQGKMKAINMSGHIHDSEASRAGSIPQDACFVRAQLWLG